jgi:hypothetical protein
LVKSYEKRREDETEEMRSRAKALNRRPQTGAFWGRLSGQALRDDETLHVILTMLLVRISICNAKKGS